MEPFGLKMKEVFFVSFSIQCYGEYRDCLFLRIEL